MTDPVLTAAEVALELRISKSQVSKVLCGQVKGLKPLPQIKVGRRRLVLRSVFERWKQENVSGMLPVESEKNAVTPVKGVH